MVEGERREGGEVEIIECTTCEGASCCVLRMSADYIIFYTYIHVHVHVYIVYRSVGVELIV